MPYLLGSLYIAATLLALVLAGSIAYYAIILRSELKTWRPHLHRWLTRRIEQERLDAESVDIGTLGPWSFQSQEDQEQPWHTKSA